MTDFVSRSQVLPYLKRLTGMGHKINILSFEKPGTEKSDTKRLLSESLASYGIKWMPRRYHKNPAVPATIFDLFQGLITGLNTVRKEKIEAIHARGYVPALIGCMLKGISKKPVIFDMRGFWPDEKVDANYWKPNGIVYRIVKEMERYLLKHADEIVVLAESARDRILKMGIARSPISVIPCCADLDIFRKVYPLRPDKGLAGRMVMIYAGNLGTFYNLDKIFDFFAFLKKRHADAFLRLVSNYPKTDIQKMASERGIADYRVDTLEHKDMPEAFSAASFSVIFYNRKLSGDGCSPIKLAESLACGTPVIINDRIGDSSLIVEGERVGFVLSDFNQTEYMRAIKNIEELLSHKEETAARCVNVAKKHFSLDMGVERYRAIYDRVSGRFGND